MAPPPTPEEWIELQPIVTRWYLKEQRTARWIEAEIRQRHGLCVTTKMLRDRFKSWNLQTKYNKSKTRPVKDAPIDLQPDQLTLPMSEYEAGSRHSQVFWVSSNHTAAMRCPPPNDAPLINTKMVDLNGGIVSRALNTASDDEALTKALKAMQDYFSNLTDKIQAGYLQPDDHLNKEQAFEVQRVAASAHQAVASAVYSSHRTFADLTDVGTRAARVLPELDVSFMHPRVLTVLLRLIVDGTSACDGNTKQREEPNILGIVKALFQKVSTTRLFRNHPVALVCTLPDDENQTNRLLHYQMLLTKNDLYDKVRWCNPEFVAWEEVYSARVLASLGHTAEAEILLESVFTHVEAEQHLFLHADACRTLGFSQIKAGRPEQAIECLNAALAEFQWSGNDHTENAFYTHLALSWAYREHGELYCCELNLWEALALWEFVESLKRTASAVKVIRDLDRVLGEQGKLDAQTDLREQHASYFEGLRDPS